MFFYLFDLAKGGSFEVKQYFKKFCTGCKVCLVDGVGELRSGVIRWSIDLNISYCLLSMYFQHFSFVIPS